MDLITGTVVTTWREPNHAPCIRAYQRYSHSVLLSLIALSKHQFSLRMRKGARIISVEMHVARPTLYKAA